MKRDEIVLRKIGCDYIDGRKDFTQLGLSKDLGVSLSIVNKVVSDLKDINAVRIGQRSFTVIALDRLLLFWAVHRNLKRDIIYHTRAGLPVKEVERSMPDGVAFTGYTAYRFIFNEAPADYSEVYVYATENSLEELKRRFPPNEKIPNLIVLKCDNDLEDAILAHTLKKSSVCKAQIFADLWNMNQWYAKGFVDALSKRIGI